MGRNSKARRDARRRQQAGRRPGQHGQSGAAFGSGVPPRIDPAAVADLEVTRHVRRMSHRCGEAEARERARAILGRGLPPWAVASSVLALLDRLTGAALRGGWDPSELADVTARFLGEGHGGTVRAIAGRVRRQLAEAWRPEWDDQLAGLGEPAEPTPSREDDLAVSLRVIALFAALPAADLTGVRAPSPADGSRDSAKLAQVRALLAKAESTPYQAEAEALSAKAQELISRYSLQLLLAQETGHHPDLTYRRIWLDAPYLDAKASLVKVVGDANRCRVVYDATLGFCTVIGSAFDIDATELMLTSLLAQAQQAMLVHGSRTDRAGRSRTRSFRQSFLVSFAHHIGERLQQVAEQSVADTTGSLLPALRSHDLAVEELTRSMFPQLVQKVTQVNDAEGWAGGRAAAELAQLDFVDHLPA